MKISYIITISPVIEMEYLNILIKSLNLQTVQDFNVIFYNQTVNTEKEIFDTLQIKPNFNYKFFSIESEYFFGNYPIWDLYGFHQMLIENEILEDYHMSLHPEEFLDIDYTEKILNVLEKYSIDILMGNLHSTNYSYMDFCKLNEVNNSRDFSLFLQKKNLSESMKWKISSKPFFLTRYPLKNFILKKALHPGNGDKQNNAGFKKLNYYLEDVFVMSTDFAQKYNWYNSEIKLYFEDIHINRTLESLMKKITNFPLYFTEAKIYHLNHGKYYYQIEDYQFTKEFLNYNTQNPILLSLKKAIKYYQNGNITAKAALRLSRNEGTVDVNYKFHKKNIEDAIG
ncbi:MAG: hypothetical protein GF353_24190 [Candidatus Lokiarchaeota archaeon]|nr:hypothetical protein [Candidatus Lokiarchaeota archaeon]